MDHTVFYGHKYRYSVTTVELSNEDDEEPRLYVTVKFGNDNSPSSLMDHMRKYHQKEFNEVVLGQHQETLGQHLEVFGQCEQTLFRSRIFDLYSNRTQVKIGLPKPRPRST